MSMRLLFHKNERVNTNKNGNDRHYVEEISSSQDDAEVSHFLGDDLVFKRVQAEQAALLHIV